MSGARCCENPPNLDPSGRLGRVEKIGGLDAYVSGDPQSKNAVLFVSDAIGFEAPNLRKLADKVAAAGYFAVVPDFFFGDPFAPDNPDRSIHVWVKDHGTMCAFGFLSFSRQTSRTKGLEDAKPVVTALKSKGISAIGAVGFCWGAKVVVGLSISELIQAAVLMHPAVVTVDDIKGVKAPIAILGAEFDHTAPPALLKQFEEVLASRPEIDGYVKIFPNVRHGWTVRYDVKDEAVVKAAEEAHENMLEWFAKYVK